MCGRFYIPEADGPEELIALINRAELKLRARQPDFRLNRGEICPGDSAAVLAPNRDRETAFFVMRWGFRLDKRLVFNARSETAADKAMFRDSMRARRCVIPSAAFFEWDHRLKKPAKFRFWPDDGALTYLAGLYRFESDASLPVFTVLTRQAQGTIADLHDRMPVILRAEQIGPWLDQGADPQAIMNAEPPALACRAETPIELPLSI